MDNDPIKDSALAISLEALVKSNFWLTSLLGLNSLYDLEVWIVSEDSCFVDVELCFDTIDCL